MIRFAQISGLLLIAVLSLGQSSDTEYWRDLGYKAKVKGNYLVATENYQKILEIDSTDYDAFLALGNLYIIQEKYKIATWYYNQIYQNDSTDVEALNGLGKCNMYMGKNKKSVWYFEKALHFLASEVQQYFYLAKAYSYAGKLKEAIVTYENINKIDSTYSETWAGLGKMYYWTGKPELAVSYYTRALQLDPENVKIINEFNQIQNELKFGLTAKVKPLTEIEETYKISAIVSSIKLEKRLDDHFHIDVNVLLDYSNRVFTNNIGDTTRLYDASWIKGSWITEHHKLSAYVGYSVSDNLFSTYGINWKLNYSFGKFIIKNSITAGYDYFYYWNEVGGKSISDVLSMSYDRLGFSASYTSGIIDPVLIADLVSDTYDTIENPYNAYSFSLFYKLLKKPVIKIGLSHSFLNFKYKSPLYYTPFNRKLTGVFASIYYQLNKFYLYGSFAYNLGTEVYYEETNNGNGNGNDNGNTFFKEVELNVNNWSTNIEIGYNADPFTFSIGGGNFYNPFYQNITGFAAIKFLF